MVGLLDDLSDAERAYLDSGGEKTEGLGADAPGGAQPAGDAATSGAQPGQSQARTEPAGDTSGAPPQPATGAGGDDDEHGGFEFDVPGRGKMRVVDHRALKAERTRNKELREQLATLNERFARGDERLRLLTEALQAPAAPPAQQQEPEEEANPFEDALPDREKDIFGYVDGLEKRLNYVMGQLQTQLPKLSQGVEQTRGEVKQSREEQEFRTRYRDDVFGYARSKPEFLGPRAEDGSFPQNAYFYLLNARSQQLAMQGYSQQEIPGILAREEKGLADRAYASGKNPAEFIYNLAVSFGFKPQAALPAPTGGAGQPGGGTPQPGAGGSQPGGQQQPTVSSVVQDLERIAAGQAAARTLSGAGGGAPNQLSLEALAAMSDRDFEAMYAKHGAAIENLLGGAH
jgi:hypothetical protein